MKKLMLFISIIIFSVSIFAHGPTPQKVQESITVGISPSKAYAALKDFSAFKKFMKTRSSDDDLMKVKYALLKEDGPFTDYNAYIIVRKGSNDNESIIQWTARFYRTYKLNPPIPKGQDDATAKAAVQAIVEKGLKDLKNSLSSN